MITRIEGKFVEIEENSVTINVDGVFYQVFVSKSVLTSLQQKKTGDDVYLVTYHYLQSDPSRSLPVLIGFNNKIERDKIADLITTQPKQAQLALYSILSISQGANKFIFTGEVYESYKKYCSDLGIRPLTQRRMSDILSELDMLGIITARVISKGRYGRTREIMLAPQATTPVVKRLLEEALNL